MTPVAVDPGAHRIVVGAPGMHEVSVSLVIAERQQLDVPLRLDTAAGDAVASVPAPTAGVLTAGGVVMWLVAPSHNADQALGLTPMPLPGGGGLVATGQWR